MSRLAIGALGVAALGAAGGILFLLSSGAPRPAKPEKGETAPPPARAAAPAAPTRTAAPPAAGAPSAAPAPEAAPAPRTGTAVTVSVPDDKVDELATRLTLRPEQTQALRAVFSEEAQILQRKIAELREGRTPPGTQKEDAVKRVLDEAKARMETRIRMLLDPPQVAILEQIQAEEREKERGR